MVVGVYVGSTEFSVIDINYSSIKYTVQISRSVSQPSKSFIRSNGIDLNLEAFASGGI